MNQKMLRWIVSLTVSGLTACAAVPNPPATRSMSEVLAASKPSDWRPLEPDCTIYLDLPSGHVVLELAPQFAPHHVDNIRTLVREHYFDGAAITRVQDNFVVQWSNPDDNKPIGSAKRTLEAEFTRPLVALPFRPLPDVDGYAPETGFIDGFPVARDVASGRAWAVHCYGMLGVGRDDAADSGGGTELYVVIGQAPRQLDRNVTLVGRVVSGIELLAALPRGTGALGFYEKPEQRTTITRVRLGSDVPESERAAIELLRTDTATFGALVESRRNRREGWYKEPAGHIDVCNVPLPSRAR
jgi:peptidylprolyl isomerase